MEPRMIFRTHYQVDEPAYMEFLIKFCTSGVRSSYKETIASKIANEIRLRGGKFNEAAGGYAVDLARALMLITDNNVWTDKGYLVDLIAKVGDRELKDELLLTTAEKILHFRIFLEADGATLHYLSRYILEHGSLPPSGVDNNSLVQDMFIDILANYLTITSNTRERVALRREIERIERKRYRGNSGAHKLFIHAQTLYRLGLVSKRDTQMRIYYLPEEEQEMKAALKRFIVEIPDITKLEEVVNTNKIIEIVAHVFDLQCEPWEHIHHKEALMILARYYNQVISTGAPLCSISTLLEAIQIEMMSRGVLARHDDVYNLIISVQKRNPKDIRFHVDRRGRLAFIKVSDHLVENFADKVEIL